jgi:prolyl-tRNA editing enzyme YbaK/EbsC (Cys-tRNA(Pro) deacylase)
MDEAAMKMAAHPSALRVQQILGNGFQVLEFEASTRTAAEAAAAVGCDVAQIAKSIVFRGGESGRAVLVITSGRNRVDEQKIALLLGERVRRADADFVRAQTGYAIGGVPPIGHDSPPVIFIDADLKTFDRIWAAAGTPNAVFELTFGDLLTLTGGTVAEIAKTAA